MVLVTLQDMAEKLKELTDEMDEIKQERKTLDSKLSRNSRVISGQDFVNMNLNLSVPLASAPLPPDPLVKPATRAQSERAHSVLSQFLGAHEASFEQAVARQKAVVEDYKELLALFAEDSDTPPENFFGPLSAYCKALEAILAKHAEERRLAQMRLERAATMPKKSGAHRIDFQPPALQPATELGTLRLKHTGGNLFIFFTLKHLTAHFPILFY